MRSCKFVLLFVTLIMLQGCNDESANFEQEYYLAVSHTNFAWGSEHKGVYIDRNGDVYQYSISDWDNDFEKLPTGGPYTRQELDDLYSLNLMYLDSIEAVEFANMKSLIAGASTGQISEPIFLCFDIGEYNYVAYTHDPVSGLYTEISLYKAGDWTSSNLDPNAQTLKDWLKQLGRDYQISFDTPCGT